MEVTARGKNQGNTERGKPTIRATERFGREKKQLPKKYNRLSITGTRDSQTKAHSPGKPPKEVH